VAVILQLDVQICNAVDFPRNLAKNVISKKSPLLFGPFSYPIRGAAGRWQVAFFLHTGAAGAAAT